MGRDTATAARGREPQRSKKVQERKNAQDLIAKLAAERDALLRDEIALRDAETLGDVAEVAEVLRVVEARKRVIARLEIDACSAVEQAARERAATWLAQQARQLEDAGSGVAAAQRETQAQLAALIDVIDRESALRRSIQTTLTGVEVMQARFPELKAAGVTAPTLPEARDYAIPVMQATGRLVPAHRRKRLNVVHTPADTPEVIRERSRRAAEDFARRYVSAIPSEVLAIIDSAPLPADPTVTERERKERERADQERADLARFDRERAAQTSIPS
jgi:hypothetical protein